MICEGASNCLALNFGSNVKGEIARRKTVLEHRSVIAKKRDIFGLIS